MASNDGVRLDLPNHEKIHPVIYISHIIPYPEQPEGIKSTEAEKSGPVPEIEGEQHTFHNFLSHRKKGRRFQVAIVSDERNPHHEAAC